MINFDSLRDTARPDGRQAAQCNFSIPRELLASLDAVVEQLNCPRSSFITAAVEAALEAYYVDCPQGAPVAPDTE